MVGLKLHGVKYDLKKIDILISTLTSNHCEKDKYFYICCIISLILCLFGFYFFFYNVKKEETRDGCFC